MKFLFLYSDVIQISDIPWGLMELGHKVETLEQYFTFEIENKKQEEFLKNRLANSNYDAVFGYNFIPCISAACEACKVPYISWVYDSPELFLYTKEVKNQYNYLFVFDKAQYQELQRFHLPHLWHFPLAVNLSRLGALHISDQDIQTYSADISFVGQLYENNNYNQMLPLLSPDMKTHFHQEFLKRAGRWNKNNKIPFSYTQEEIEFLDHYFQGSDSVKALDLPKEQFYYTYMFPHKLTEIDRNLVLNRLGEEHEVTVYSGDKGVALSNVIMKDRIPYDTTMNKIFFSSKINLNITLRSIESGVPLRVMDIMGVGGFLLTNYQEEIEEMFELDEDLVIYHDIDELSKKAEYYLSHEKQRKQIAMNGYKKIRDKHTYLIKLEEMIARVFEKPDISCEKVKIESKPLVSVIIPTYNRRKVLERAINSVLSQTYDNLQVIVVDDGSLDDTKEYVKQIPDSRVTYMGNSRNRGVTFARNAGMRRAKGEYIAFQDSDDEWLPDKLEKQIAYLKEHPEYEACFTQYCVTNTKQLIPYFEGENQKNAGENHFYPMVLSCSFVGAPTLVMSRRLLEEIGYFSQELRCYEDYEYSIRLAKTGKLALIPEILVLVHSELEEKRLSHINEETVRHHINAMLMIIEKYKEDMVKCGGINRQRDILLEMAQEYHVKEQVEQLLSKILE